MDHSRIGLIFIILTFLLNCLAIVCDKKGESIAVVEGEFWLRGRRLVFNIVCLYFVLPGVFMFIFHTCFSRVCFLVVVHYRYYKSVLPQKLPKGELVGIFDPFFLLAYFCVK